MSGSTSKSSPVVVQPTGEEQSLAAIQLEVAREALNAFRDQGEFQRLQAQLQPQAVADIGARPDVLTSLAPGALEGFTQAQFGAGGAGLARSEELAQLEADRIREGFAATPEQIELIRQTTDAEIAAGIGDIERFTGNQLESIREELGPRLGLRTGDTPLVDRGGRVAQEGIDAAARLVTDLRGKEAAARLNFPLAAGAQTSAASQFQQGAGTASANAISGLSEAAFANRLALAGQVGNQGLGLATGFNFPQSQSSLKPVVGSKQKASAGGVL